MLYSSQGHVVGHALTSGGSSDQPQQQQQAAPDQQQQQQPPSYYGQPSPAGYQQVFKMIEI